MMLRGAKIDTEWVEVPTVEMIRAADRERLLATLSAPVEIEDDDRELGAALLAERSPEDIAALLVRAHRAKMPAPEEMAARGEAPTRMDGPRPGFEDTVWFKMNVGRRQNADARWLLPLLCRRGHITKSEIGAIRIAQDETAFEVPRAVAARFVASVKRTATDEDDGLMFAAMDGPPQQGGGAPRGPRPTLGTRPPARHHATPYKGKGAPRGGPRARG